MTDIRRPPDKLPAEVEAVAEAAAQALASIARPMAEVVRTFAGAVRGAAERAVRDDDPRRNEMAQRKSRSRKGGRKYGQAASKTVERAMHEMTRGTLKSGRSGKRVKSRKQAIAIGLSEARKRGAKVPRKRGSSRSSSRKK